LFQIPNHYSSGDLHAVWDSVLYQYHIPLELPFTNVSWAEMGAASI